MLEAARVATVTESLGRWSLGLWACGLGRCLRDGPRTAGRRLIPGDGGVASR